MLSINGYKKTSKGENLGLIDILLLSRYKPFAIRLERRTDAYGEY